MGHPIGARKAGPPANKLTDADRFATAMSQVGGAPHERLTYSELTGKDESPRYEATRTREAEAPF
jgi:hypothetical protein